MARSNLGAALSVPGRYQEAIGEYRAALERAPAHAGVRLNLALALSRSDDFAAAAAEPAAVSERDAENRQAVLMQADCYLRLGENLKLIAMPDPYARFHPNDDRVACQRGMALLRDGQIQCGQAVIDRLLRRGDGPEVQMLIGASRLFAANHGTALKTLEGAGAGASRHAGRPDPAGDGADGERLRGGASLP
ncbi:MAG: hypothetical protein KatS3mg004_3765 [Bryobacteraceae bacterium]|nr:MAG: hypothetical protein KatS3mg004_3765 [Bryobacteraceae bacterium]